MHSRALKTLPLKLLETQSWELKEATVRTSLRNLAVRRITACPHYSALLQLFVCFKGQFELQVVEIIVRPTYDSSSSGVQACDYSPPS